MNLSDLTYAELDIINDHNLQGDQCLKRALSNRYRKRLGGDVREVVALCNYGNLYFLQFWTNGVEAFQRVDWIRKTDLNKKYKNLDMASIPVRDGILEVFRNKLNATINGKIH